MDFNRRDFLKLSGALASVSILNQTPVFALSKDSQNMCGFKAPKIENVRVAVIGIGNRGLGAVKRLIRIEGLQIVALCDKVPEKVNKAMVAIKGKHKTIPEQYSGENGWKDLLSKKNFDLVYICTPWSYHAQMSVQSMKHGGHVACEVPIALTVEECWDVVKTSESTQKHCMMLENCCYDFFELLTLNMSRQGLFGEIVHAEGAYIHDLMEHNFSKKYYESMWRLEENIKMNGNLYPTHGIGPVAQCLNINRGDKFDFLVSVSSNDFSMNVKANELAASDTFFEKYRNRRYRGNMNLTTIKTAKGKTISVQHDVSSPRPYSRIHILSGTKGYAQKYPEPGKIAFGHKFLSENELQDLYDKHMPKIVKVVGDAAKKIGGHGGMDFMMDWRLIDCLRNGLPLDQDVYDAASWSCIVPLSEKSLNARSRSVDIPDFTRGNWTGNAPLDLESGGFNTGVI